MSLNSRSQYFLYNIQKKKWALFNDKSFLSLQILKFDGLEWGQNLDESAKMHAIISVLVEWALISNHRGRLTQEETTKKARSKTPIRNSIHLCCYLAAVTINNLWQTVTPSCNSWPNKIKCRHHWVLVVFRKRRHFWLIRHIRQVIWLWKSKAFTVTGELLMQQTLLRDEVMRRIRNCSLPGAIKQFCNSIC